MMMTTTTRFWWKSWWWWIEHVENNIHELRSHKLNISYPMTTPNTNQSISSTSGSPPPRRGLALWRLGFALRRLGFDGRLPCPRESRSDWSNIGSENLYTLDLAKQEHAGIAVISLCIPKSTHKSYACNNCMLHKYVLWENREHGECLWWHIDSYRS